MKDEIKPNTKVKILSKKHLKLVEKLAFESGFKWFRTGSYNKPVGSGEFIVFWDDMDMTLGKGYVDHEEILIPMLNTSNESEKTNKTKGECAPTTQSPHAEMHKLFSHPKADEICNSMADEKEKHSHYFKDVSSLDKIDVYDVCGLFGVYDSSGAIHHAVKKLLCAGGRGYKDTKKDLEEARDSINRKLQMMEDEK